MSKQYKISIEDTQIVTASSEDEAIQMVQETLNLANLNYDVEEVDDENVKISKDNDNSKPQYTYVYGDECDDIWDRFKMTVRNDDDRIKLQFVEFQGEGSYE